MSFFEILTIIIPSTLLTAAPLIFTSLGGMFSERSGVVNIGLEGLMAVGAFTAAVSTLGLEHAGLGNASPWIAILIAGAIGGLFSLIHAVVSISFRADQTVSGVALNFLAAGLTIFLVKLIFDGKGQTPYITHNIDKVDIPGLAKLPFLGPIFFQQVAYTSYIAIFIAILCWFIVYKTPFGLRLRSVGEHPAAADTLGISVIKMRYIGVLLSGVLGGIGGAVYLVTITSNYNVTTIAGQGFLALAALVFGKWHPIGAMGASLFFGFAQALSITSQQIPYLDRLPSVFMLIAPYVLTLIVLTGFVGRAEAPKADGVPYIKGQR
ncbi:ABC transporter permease [Sporolactobacillus terrae]|uniref:ABC transporter permease n=1 Tax=Sporolactobacillus terrae TaxID=269673 RepID=A0A410DC72_9BACL|nr:ABC transporter permease [Sporolactobacillus terrae]QAA23634.1 ABC transporter permease [Sporolactobacillus terrae]QAA26604.1 ABC transporter permease [Sporolactobacillus terrae]UAK15676.1 ABC transporter permease [Sporolactobacillus terrae]BBO00144.1 ABC transporter permease [Sporolactobacillus terrae]